MNVEWRELEDSKDRLGMRGGDGGWHGEGHLKHWMVSSAAHLQIRSLRAGLLNGLFTMLQHISVLQSLN